ncbi:unnamed protein product [Lota lota]
MDQHYRSQERQFLNFQPTSSSSFAAEAEEVQAVCAAFARSIVREFKATATYQVEGHCDKHNLSAPPKRENRVR